MKTMRRGVSLLLAAMLFFTMAGTAFAAGPTARAQTSVALHALDVVKGQTSIRDNRHEMNADTTKDLGAIALTDGRLPANADSRAPEMAGWKFVGWYTSPVRYYFWGDNTTSGYQTEPIPEDFKYDLQGKLYDFTPKDKGDGASEYYTLTDYWRWLTSLEDRNGRQVKAGEEVPIGVSDLYAAYAPSTIKYTLDSSGWPGGGFSGTCGRWYGTPFGNDYTQKNTRFDGEEYVFEGWFLKGTNDRMEFYDVPADKATYVAHWYKKNDQSVNWQTYAEKGYAAVKRITVSTTGTRIHSLSESVPLELVACSGTRQTVEASTDRPEVTKLTWISNDSSIAKVEAIDGTSMRVDIVPGYKAGETTITVKAGSGQAATFKVVNKEHEWATTTVVKAATCTTPSTVRQTCAYCRKVHTVVNDDRKAHNYAYRDIPETCATPHIWEHYCKDCGYVDHSGDKLRGPATGKHEWEEKGRTPMNCCTVAVTYACKTCGMTEVRYEAGLVRPGSDHSWGTWKTTKAPTTTAQGTQIRTCTICGATETHTLPKLSTALVKETPKAPATQSKPAATAAPKAATQSKPAATAAPKAATASKPAATAAPKAATASKPAPTAAPKAATASKPAATAAPKAATVSKPAQSAVTKQTTASKAANTIKASNITKTASTKAQSFKLNAKANGDAKLTYASDNKSVTVDKDGKVTVKANFSGKATITIKAAATSTYSAASKKITVTVNKAANTIKASNITKTVSTKAQSFKVGAKANGGAKLTYASNNKSVTVNSAGKITVKADFVGKATITIKSAATNVYKAASKKIIVKINPTATKLSAAKNSAAKKMTVTWKKNKAVTGYQIQYSTSKTFKSGVKTVTVKKNGTTSTNISGLEKGTTYYVRIRTYKTVSKANYYSSWSAAKAVKITK